MGQPQLSSLHLETEHTAERATFWRKPTFAEALFSLLAVAYLFLFWKSVSRWWFNPRWSTDDALQQVFPFYTVWHPEIFQGDLIFELMRGYLAPLHWALGYMVTWLCGDPIMTAHYLMFIQLVLCGGFIFFAVRTAAGLAPAFFSLLFLFHTRHVIQRMTGGLPRGWAAVLFAAFFYFSLTKNHRAVIALLFAGCLLNPPATFLIAASYGLVLLVRCVSADTRIDSLRHLATLALCAPLIFALTLWVTKRPPEIGRMYSYHEAEALPEFSRDGGRFSWIPFLPPATEITQFATRVFYGRFDKPDPFWRKNILGIGIVFLILMTLIGVIRKRSAVPIELWCFLAASITVYFLSRILAFKLYVPDRHLNIPLAFFWILALSIGTWRALFGLGQANLPRDTFDSSLKFARGSVIGLLLVSALVYQGSQLNLSTDANFNYQDTKRGAWVPWLKENTPPSALIAGFPTFMDPVQLFGMRKAYASSETWHPFYDNYNAEMKRRIAISLKAHYAASLEEVVSLLTPEKIDYFVFERKRFYPKALQNVVYFKVFRPLLAELTGRPPEQYAYRQIPESGEDSSLSFVVYRDKTAVVIDVNKLRAWVAEHPGESNAA